MSDKDNFVPGQRLVWPPGKTRYTGETVIYLGTSKGVAMQEEENRNKPWIQRYGFLVIIAVAIVSMVFWAIVLPNK